MRGCNLTVSLFYCCYICHFILLQDCSDVKEVVSAGPVWVTAGQDNIDVSLRYLSTHTPIRFDKFSEIMATLHNYHYDHAQSRPRCSPSLAPNPS